MRHWLVASGKRTYCGSAMGTEGVLCPVCVEMEEKALHLRIIAIESAIESAQYRAKVDPARAAEIIDFQTMRLEDARNRKRELEEAVDE